MNKRFYTWVDIDSVLRIALERGQWPAWLQAASCYVLELELQVEKGTNFETIFDWLREVFGPRVLDVDGAITVKLDGGADRAVFVVYEEVDADVFDQPKLLFGSSSRLSRFAPYKPASSESSSLLPIYAFHSFKGGVGRTTTALALAIEIARDSADRPSVLLIDADMEAPGISYLLETRVPDYPISFADFLALANEGLADPGLDSVGIVADALSGLDFDGVTVLPAFRGSDAYETNGVRPEHLIRNSSDPFILSTLLRKLGDKLGVDAVVIDLRAGISEISSGLLLDPTVDRVLVTTLGGQSLAGTKSILARVLRSDALLAASVRLEKNEGVNIVFSQVRDDQKVELLGAALADMLDGQDVAVEEGVGAAPDRADEYYPRAVARLLTVDYVGALARMSRSWTECWEQVDRSGVGDSIRAVADFVLTARGRESKQNLDHDRARLEEFSRAMEYAESAGGRDFLITGSLERIARDHVSEVPLLAVVGQKGSGKSYTFMQVMRSGDWGIFSGRVTGKPPGVPAQIFPVLAPFNMRDKVLDLVESTRASFSQTLGTTPATRDDLLDKIRKGLSDNLHQGEWRDLWLNAFAAAMGLPAGPDPTAAIVDAMGKAGMARCVLVIDGLEDLFQDIHSSPTEQCALRALLHDVLSWVAQIPSRPVGLVIFVRRDMVLAAIKQNPGQFLHRFLPYELRWDRAEALRLVDWLAHQAGVLPKQAGKEDSEAKLAEHLVPLWGLKLGSADSREAHSAEWVLAALSDFRGQVQARDVVRFMRAAAHESTGDTYWSDRLLVPSAIKKAPVTCGTEKINEIEQETPKLREVFVKLRALSPEARRVPLLPVGSGLSFEEMEMLELNGIVLREPDGYYMPEMYRQGLNFALAKGARPRVLALARRVVSGSI